MLRLENLTSLIDRSPRFVETVAAGREAKDAGFSAVIILLLPCLPGAVGTSTPAQATCLPNSSLQDRGTFGWAD